MGVLDSKVAFITGVARGQGRSHAIRMAEEGADIIGVDLCEDIATVPYSMATEEDLRETVKEVESLDRRILTAKIDVRDRKTLSEFVGRSAAELGRLDIVVANAGVSPLKVVTEDIDTTWSDVIGVNLTGVFNTIQAALPALLESKRGGSIVITSSTAGIVGLSLNAIGGYAYTASKHGVVGLMRGFARDLAPHSIRVNTVHPTGVPTTMVVNPAMEEFIAASPEATATLHNLLPVEVIDAVDVSNAIVWLASDAPPLRHRSHPARGCRVHDQVIVDGLPTIDA